MVIDNCFGTSKNRVRHLVATTRILVPNSQ